jgi:hypothetical protein
MIMTVVKNLLGIIVVCATFAATTYNQSRLDRNDAMRRIPKEIESALKHFVFKPTFDELKGQMEFFRIYTVMGIFFQKHKDEFIAELDKQIKMASNG